MGTLVGWHGLPSAHLYDPFTDTWTELPEMNAGRWYPTNTTLANGDVLVVSGAIAPETVNTLPQVWQTATGTWRSLTNANSLDGGNALYPWMFLAPNGRVFKAGPERRSRFLDTSGLGAWSQEPRSYFGARDEGTAVMYDVGKGLIAGGNQQLPTATAEVFNLNGPTPTWRRIASMAFARRFLTATLLPDGTVLVTGGTSQANARYDGKPGIRAKWFSHGTLESCDGNLDHSAAMQIPRSYHSTAALLPDGRVLVGGSEAAPPLDKIDQRSFEIFSPPYLFKGARPLITDAPVAVAYGEMFFVETPDAMDITHVNWIRLSSVTHAFNQNQRINHLHFTPTPDRDGLHITAPANANLAPPGHYMLFILNDDGVPSVARIVQLCNPAVAACTALPPGDPPPVPPLVVIAPPATTTVVSGTPLTFTGEASDAEDGELTDSLTWSSNLDGSLGTGGTVTTSLLALGSHTITASVTDSDSLTGSDSITVNVTAPPRATARCADGDMREICSQYCHIGSQRQGNSGESDHCV